MTAGSGALDRGLQLILSRLAARMPGRRAILAVERLDGSFTWTGAAGHATGSGTPMRRDSPFFIASIDKLFNAAIVLKLVERHQVALDAPLAAYLPPRITGRLHRLHGIDYSDRITIRHLLGHASGLPDWLEDRPAAGHSLVDQILRHGDRALALDDIADLVRDRLQPHFPPQDLAAARPRVRYSDTNYMLLAAVIEAVAGQPLHRVHLDQLYEPLGLRHTFFPGQSGPLDPTPEAVELHARGRLLSIPKLMRSINGIYATTDDLLAFLRSLVNGRVVRHAEALAVMQARWHRFPFPTDRAALRAPGWPVEYGLGIMRFRLPRVLTPFRPMPAVVGHTGSTGCWLFHCPARNLLLAGSVDEVTAGAVPYRVVPKMLRLFPV